jgi:hypothetical protein
VEYRSGIYSSYDAYPIIVIDIDIPDTYLFDGAGAVAEVVNSSTGCGNAFDGGVAVVGNGAACEDGSFDFGFATIFNSTA